MLSSHWTAWYRSRLFFFVDDLVGILYLTLDTFVLKTGRERMKGSRCIELRDGLVDIGCRYGFSDVFSSWVHLMFEPLSRLCLNGMSALPLEAYWYECCVPSGQRFLGVLKEAGAWKAFVQRRHQE